MTLRIRYASRTDRGVVREGNEDSVFAGDRILAVADGMGGHAAGEVASGEVIDELRRLDGAPYASNPADALVNAMEVANGRLRERVAADPALEGMGTTLTAAFVADDRMALIHVGDSRAYRWTDGALAQLTVDDTFVQRLVNEGRLTPAEALVHPQRSLLTQALDGRDVEPQVQVFEVHAGERYLFCTDGLSGVVPAEVMAEAMQLADPADAVDTLVDAALVRGAPDNVTCIVADVVVDTDAPVAPAPPGGRRRSMAAAGAAGAAAGGVGLGDTADLDTPSDLLTEPEVAQVAGPAAPVAGTARVVPDPEADDDGEAPRRRRVPRWLAFLLGLLVTLLGLALVTVLWLANQYFVADADGKVAIYQGVPVAPAGIELARVVETTEIAVADLQPTARAKVEDGITAGSRSDAEQAVADLEDQLLPACPADAAELPNPPVPGTDCREVTP